MTISKVIERVRQLRPTSLSHEELADLVIRLEADIYSVYLDKPMPEQIEWTDELIAPFPYDIVYLDYVIAKIDQLNGDSSQFGLSSDQFYLSKKQLGSHLIRSGMAKLTPRDERRIF